MGRRSKQPKKRAYVSKAESTSSKMNLGSLASEIATVGLSSSNGYILEECNEALSWPRNKATYAKMGLDPSISAARASIKSFIRKAKYRVTVGATLPSEVQKEQINLISTCMDDMATSFQDTINEMLSFLQYGYAVNEKVFKYRNNKGKYKSLHDDGRVGWAKLPIRSQDSISRWIFDDKGRELLAVEQDTSLFQHNYNPTSNKPSQGLHDHLIEIPRKKFLHIRHDVERNNPEGRSPYKSCYVPWMYKSKIEEFQAMGVSRDLGGLPVNNYRQL